MALNKLCRLCASSFIHHTNILRIQCSSVTNLARKKLQNEGQLVIRCKRDKYDHYMGQEYKKFDVLPLASKGWDHSKSKGDFFIVYPNTEELTNLPQKSLDEIGINANLLAALHQQNITKITSFQEEANTTILQGKHCMLTAETGSGKTLSYVLPILQSLINGKVEQMNAPRALILTPSRELAYQVGSVIEPLAHAVGLKVCVMVGGRTKRIMLNPEFKEMDLLVTTPGLVGKLSTTGVIRLNNVATTVLDEADTLLDDSFVERMTTILNRIAQSQLTLVSATMPKKLPAILEPYEPHLIHITSPLLHKPLSNITQRFLRLTRSGKPPHILEIVKNNKSPLLIFANRSDTCNWLGIFFAENGLKYARINGKMNYSDRIEEWNKFVTGRVNVLISTDVGSRGLDTTQIRHVVNYDFPIYAADYLHRIGRTGRFGSPKECKVTNFISGPEEVRLVQLIELAIRKNEALLNVDGNITKLLTNKIMRAMREEDTA